MLALPRPESPCYAASVPEKIDIAIVGAGRLGTVLALSLTQAGYRVREIIVRGESSRKKARGLSRRVNAPAVPYKHARLQAGLVWLCVPDREIEQVAERLATTANWKGKVVFHSSGALTSDQLAGLRRRGAAVASVHPMMTFVRGSMPSLDGVLFGVEGDSAAVRLARSIVSRLGGEVFPIAKRGKTAYHTWGTFASPLLLALLVTAEEVAHRAGMPRRNARASILPIARQTLDNYAVLGSAQGFSGPIVRGDVATVRKHLKALRTLPDVKAVYVALARAALRFLPAGKREELRKAVGSKAQR